MGLERGTSQNKRRIAMSDKTLSNTELELTQKIQLHFPRGIISAKVLK